MTNYDVRFPYMMAWYCHTQSSDDEVLELETEFTSYQWQEIILEEF